MCTNARTYAPHRCNCVIEAQAKLFDSFCRSASRRGLGKGGGEMPHPLTHPNAFPFLSVFVQESREYRSAPQHTKNNLGQFGPIRNNRSIQNPAGPGLCGFCPLGSFGSFLGHWWVSCCVQIGITKKNHSQTQTKRMLTKSLFVMDAGWCPEPESNRHAV